MSITAVRSVGAGDVDVTTGAVEVCAVVVEDIAGGVASAALALVKWMVITAGPAWSAVRLILMGTAGLWYFSRGR